ncbi:RraA family protein [Tropicibacter sp. R16_0]|uniref:RraA family protein n=1 Tax=Tropicibacter sp. R16_0 TaxID=2821102 RepID=UPI001ADAC3A1|nr:RraA family protein [Tropicibacter sp. R16_0]MBO9453503.1 RraA family protein [Tropicibacter sp. R16_0]
MPVRQHKAVFERLSPDQLAYWAGAEAAAVSDCLDRAQAMDGGIKPLDPRARLIGQARTVRCMVGDNSALHAAINLVEPGDILVADAGGFLGNAVWGGLMAEAARQKGIAGLIVDGAVRDSAEIMVSGFPCFARGTVPAGPHKNFGGEIDGRVACGGVSVQSGDLIIADADGVTVVPLARVDTIQTAYCALKEKEARVMAELDAGGTLAGIYGVPEVTRDW